MKLYDGLIQNTSALLTGSFQAWDYDASQAWEDAGVNELVLSRDTAYELGGGAEAAVNYTLATADASLVGGDQVLLYGPDLSQIKGDCSFARVALLHIAALGEDDEANYRALKAMEFVKYHVFPKGYMMRLSASSNREQVRVSRDALTKGISFRSVGFGFIKKYKENPGVKAAKLIFVTVPGAAYRALEENAQKASDITRTLTHIMDGISTDCSSCSLKPVCDEVEGMRELHFKNAKSKDK